MAIQTAEAEAHDIEAMIADAAAATEALAREFFGPAAYVRRDVHRNVETGEDQIVFEVHFCFPDSESDFERLVVLNREFMNAFATTTNPDILYRIVIAPVPSDAD
ncbi:MAG TPA: hypothetical protein VFS20_05875 [Longimicrobium sp.]|nr:hypothetical protein [Longimicrobium sp.]